MLQINDIHAGYGDLKVLFGVSLKVEAGEVVSLVGSNGAGKTTLLRVISGFVPITSGSIIFEGEDLLAKKSYHRADTGIAHIPQGRGILGTMTVKENLLMGAYTKRVADGIEENLEKSFKLFPILKEREKQIAGSLSGGQQQMLAIARALMMDPKLLMLDEPSLGLAPIVVEEMFEIIDNVAKTGVPILIVEQNLIQALALANRGYVMETGKIVREGNAKELLEDESIKAAYLGI